MRSAHESFGRRTFFPRDPRANRLQPNDASGRRVCRIPRGRRGGHCLHSLHNFRAQTRRRSGRRRRAQSGTNFIWSAAARQRKRRWTAPRSAGFSALFVTIDTGTAGMRERDIRNGTAQLMSGNCDRNDSASLAIFLPPGMAGSFLFAGWRPAQTAQRGYSRATVRWPSSMSPPRWRIPS